MVLFARAIASTTSSRASVLTSLCSNRGLATCISTVFERVMPLLSTLQSSAGSVPVIKRKDFAAFIECDRALFQIDRGRLRHRASEFTKLRTHFFHLLFQMVLVNRAHLLGIFCLKQTLCEFEPSIHICFGKRYRLFVQLLCSRVGSSHTSVGLLTQFLGLGHVFRHRILFLVEGGLRHLAHLFGLLVYLLTHCTLLASGVAGYLTVRTRKQSCRALIFDLTECARHSATVIPAYTTGSSTCFNFSRSSSPSTRVFSL